MSDLRTRTIAAAKDRGHECRMCIHPVGSKPYECQILPSMAAAYGVTP